MSVSDIELEKLSATLLNAAGNVPLAKRFRALFTLKTLAVKNDEALRIITKGGYMNIQSQCAALTS
jgi:deoxyhypusine monooxygenase